MKLWISFNEPWIVSWLGYGVSTFAPAKWGPGTNTYIVSHNLIKSHAKAFHTYNDTYRATQNGERHNSSDKQLEFFLPLLEWCFCLKLLVFSLVCLSAKTLTTIDIAVWHTFEKNKTLVPKRLISWPKQRTVIYFWKTLLWSSLFEWLVIGLS